MHPLLQERILELCHLWEINGFPYGTDKWPVHKAIVEIAKQRPREFYLQDFWDEVARATYSSFLDGSLKLEEALDLQSQTIRALVAAFYG